MVFTIDTTKIEERGWAWSIGSLRGFDRFVAYVHGPITHQAIEGDPQEALDAALAKVEAEMDSWVAELLGDAS